MNSRRQQEVWRHPHDVVTQPRASVHPDRRRQPRRSRPSPVLTLNVFIPTPPLAHTLPLPPVPAATPSPQTPTYTQRDLQRQIVRKARPKASSLIEMYREKERQAAQQ